MLNKLASIVIAIIALITVINHESFLLPPPQPCQWRRIWMPNNYKLLMLFESIPHTKDTYSGFKLEQISFPGGNGHCIASFGGKKKDKTKTKELSWHCQLQRSRKAEKDFRVPFPWNSMGEPGMVRQFPFCPLYSSLPGLGTTAGVEPMELYRLAPWKIDGFLFRVPKLRLSPSQMG